ncbi:cilia- and flagella-associated protein 91-like [Ceratina calcarata]|uniref:Cilia- and flagella-associated protein 91 n=1 Tax=Ceratina calcarata TaxID=156304 RepID=A0AAJ7RX73_9HYME|nr:cilia- and flagella-associated protein 91-like [Ceratina calcarata]
MAGQGHRSTKLGYCNENNYLRRPIVPFLVSSTRNLDIPMRFNYSILNDVVTNAQRQCYAFSPKPEPYRNIGTQTDYRDSEAQTLPWEPPYKIKSGQNPEILSIAHMTWNHGFEISLHELEVINRMKRKKEWEATLPPMDTSANIKKRTAMINEMELDEWAFRESEIQAIMDYRLELMDELTRSREHEKQKKIQDRFDRLTNLLSMRRDKQVDSIKHKLRRELRKLHKKYREKQLPFKRDIIREHADPASELYAPQIRHGEHPQRRHAVIRKELLGESYIETADELVTLPSWLPTEEELDVIKPKPKPADLCIRATRWTKEKLSQLHSDLREFRVDDKVIESSTLLKRRYKLPPLPPTPFVQRTEEPAYARLDQFSTHIQKIIRGRAIQCMMFEGRNRCRELIEELQSSYALEDQSKKKHRKHQTRTLELQQLQTEKALYEDRLCEILNSLEGATISAMLDFLSKELMRLEDERRIHAFALLAERERAMREAAEAGRRQLEYNRRREFDEMFRQIIKVNQESVECYLEDIIKEGVEWVSDEISKEYISKLCDKVDAVAVQAQENATRLAEEEMVASMVYNFVLPEVQKNAVRKSIRDKQQAYLQNAHATIYKQLLNLPSAEETHSLDRIYKNAYYTKQDKDETVVPLKKCSTIYVTETELKSSRISPLSDIETLVENIISNIISVRIILLLSFFTTISLNCLCYRADFIKSY